MTTSESQPIIGRGIKPYYFVYPDGRIVSRSRGVDRLLKTRVKRSGQVYVHLQTEDGDREFTVHSIVALVFIGPRPKDHHVLHWDDNPLNNHVSNLRYGTGVDNEADKKRNGGIRNRKLTEEEVKNIRRLYARGADYSSLAYTYEVSNSAVVRICHNKTWKNIA